MKPACFAPFYNLNFDTSGNITVCCYNKTYILGNIGDSSIKEALNNPLLSDLKNGLLNNDFSKGCFFCEQNVKAGNSENALLKEYDQFHNNSEFNANTNLLKSLELELSNNCNLSCVMCYGKYSSTIRKVREDRSPIKNPYPDNFIEQLSPYLDKVEVIKFLGGEPFLNPIYFQIWEKVSEINPKIKLIVTTNGTVFNQRIKYLVERLNFQIIISTDSLKKSGFEKIRVGGDFLAFESNLIEFQRLMTKKGKKITLTVCPLMENYREIPELLNKSQKEGFDIYFNTVVNPIYHSTLYKSRQVHEEIINYWASKKNEIRDTKNERKLMGLIELQKSHLERSKQRLELLAFLKGQKVNSQIIESLENALYFNKKSNENKNSIEINHLLNFINKSAAFYKISIQQVNIDELKNYILNYTNPTSLVNEILSFDIESMLHFFANGTPQNLKSQMQYQFP